LCCNNYSFTFAARWHLRARESVYQQVQDCIRREGHSYVGIVLLHARLRPGDSRFLQNDAVRRKLERKYPNIERVDLTPDDAKKAATPMDSPTGGKVCLTLKPTKKLIIKVEKKDANGSSTSTSENFIAEKDGKFVIPVRGLVSNSLCSFVVRL
jgi:hypothetical protein